MKIKVIEGFSGSHGSYVTGWVYETNAELTVEAAKEYVKSGLAELVKEAKTEVEVEGDKAAPTPKKKTMKKTAPNSVEAEQAASEGK